MESLLKDLRHGFRVLLANPLFTLVAVLALALGIGANTAIFTVVNGVLLRPLPYPHPERLVYLWGVAPALDLGLDTFPATGDQFVSYRDQTDIFDRIAAFTSDSANLEGRGSPEKLGLANVTAGFFPALQVAPVLGRTFLPEEDQPGHNSEVVLSYRLWQRRFAGEKGIVGQSITLDGKDYTVVGVMPPGFEYPRGTDMPAALGLRGATDIWSPMGMTAEAATTRNNFTYFLIARLKPNVTLARAQAELSTVAARNAQNHPESYSHLGVELTPMLEEEVGKLKPALLILLGAVGFVLLIACANVANLLLARGAAREREFAIRAALGAGRLRIVRQLLVESVLLSIAGAALGLLLAAWGSQALVAATPENIPRVRDVTMDWRVLAFTMAVALLTGIIFGLIPAIHASRVDLNESLKEGSRGSTVGRRYLRDFLVAAEIALSLVLLVGAGLMIRSMVALYNQNPGLNPTNLLTLQVNVPSSRYNDAQREVLYRQILQGIQSLPGVTSAAGISDIPLTGGSSIQTFTIEGRPLPPSIDQAPVARRAIVTPDAFKTLGVPLISGRSFTEHDDRNAAGVVIVNEALVQKFYKGEEPLGKRIKLGRALNGDNRPWLTIVGVVGNVKSDGLADEARPGFYNPYEQHQDWGLAFAVRTAYYPALIVSQIRDKVWSVDKDLPISDVQTMDQILAQSVAERRFDLVLMSLFAAIALLLAAIGIYGVMAYSVTQRAHEIGIRMALGASRAEVLSLVVGRAMILAGGGIVVGLAASFGLTRLMHSLLFEVSPTDPLTFLPGSSGARRDRFCFRIDSCSTSNAHRPVSRAALRMTGALAASLNSAVSLNKVRLRAAPGRNATIYSSPRRLCLLLRVGSPARLQLRNPGFIAIEFWR